MYYMTWPIGILTQLFIQASCYRIDSPTAFQFTTCYLSHVLFGGKQ